MRWMDYYGHEKTGNEYLTGVYTKKQKKGNRKWFCCCHLCAILEMYAMNRDRLNCCGKDYVLLLLFIQLQSSFVAVSTQNNSLGLITMCVEIVLKKQSLELLENARNQFRQNTRINLYLFQIKMRMLSHGK